MLAVLQSFAGRKPTPPTLRYLRYGTNPKVIRINQDVPTCFYAVQRSRLPVIAMLLDRGLSDTNTGEVNQTHYTRFMKSNRSFPPCPFPCFPAGNREKGCRQLTRNTLREASYISRSPSGET
jgi:hypothetical protein